MPDDTRPAPTSVTCECGETIADKVTAETVTVAGETYRFRRTTDYLLCTGCGSAYPADELRRLAGVHSDGDGPQGV